MVVRKRKLRFIFKDKTTTIEGLLVARTRTDYILDLARVLQSEKASEPLVGKVEIPRSNVLFKQRIED